MLKVLICVLAGILAGLGTGFAGLSAAVFIAPMLMIFLQVDSYCAIGIALASDVLASAVSAVTYAKNGNIDVKRSWTLMVSVIGGTILGSFVAYYFTSTFLGETFMGFWLIAAMLVLGLRLVFSPEKEKAPRNFRVPDWAVGVFWGICVGFICGFQGTGGGLWMLFVLHVLLRYDFKKAVGTSVCIMSVTALIGAGGHFLMDEWPDTVMLVTCVISTFIAARVAAGIANRISPMLLKRVTGALMIVTGIGMAVIKIV